LKSSEHSEERDDEISDHSPDMSP